MDQMEQLPPVTGILQEMLDMTSADAVQVVSLFLLFLGALMTWIRLRRFPSPHAISYKRGMES